jgi:hypothetical protein
MPVERAGAKNRAGDVAVFLAPTIAALAISPIIGDGVNWGYLVFSIPFGFIAVFGRREGLRKKD